MKNNRIKLLSLLVLVAMSLSSCLNDLEDYLGDFGGSPAIAEFNEAVSAATGTINKEIKDPNVTAIEYTLRVNIASVNAFSTATTVTLEIDDQVAIDYNIDRDLHGADSAIPIPTAALTIPSMEVVIPAGEREAEWKFTLNPSIVPNIAGLVYVVPVKIVSATNGAIPSGNFGERIVRFIARNKYDGVYHVTGSFVDLTNANFTGSYPKTIALITSGGFTVDKYDVEEEFYGYLFLNNGAPTYYGNFFVYFKFDINDDFVDCINSVVDPLPRGRYGAVYTGGAAPVPNANKFFTSDRHLELSWSLNQKSLTPNLRSVMIENYEFLNARD